MKPLSMSYRERTCYICGRGRADLLEMRQQLEDLLKEDIDAVVSPLEMTIKEKKDEMQQRYSRIKNIPNNPALEFDVAAVNRDLPKFRKLIPEIDDLLAFHNEYLSRGRDCLRNPTLLEIKNRAENMDTPEIREIQRKIDIYRKRGVLSVDNLHEKKIDVALVRERDYDLEKTGRDRILLTIYVCDICDTLLGQASAAAYTILKD